MFGVELLPSRSGPDPIGICQAYAILVILIFVLTCCLTYRDKRQPEMKKTLITAAVLAASGASMAQVTLYGVADAAIGASDKVVTGSKYSQANTKVQLLANGNLTNGNSRWGIKGTEDLGGGLTAGFQFEGSINILS